MSLLGDIFGWAQKSGVLDQVQKAALAEVQQAIHAAVKKATSHAPDMAPVIESGAQKMLTAAVTGIALKQK